MNENLPTPDNEPLFQEIRGVEYTTVRTRTYKLTLYFAFFWGVVIGAILACGVVFYA